MRTIRKYCWLAYTSARSSLAYSGEVALRTIFIAVILYIFLKLWSAVYSNAGTARLGRLSLAEMLWYLMVTEAFWTSSSRVWSEVDEDVRTGRFAVHMIKPMSYSGALLGRALGERVVRFGINLVVGSAVAVILVGPIPITPVGLMMFATLAPLSFALDALGFIAIGMCAFWIESTAGLALMYSRTVMLAGGSMLPLDLYPEFLQSVLHWLPFASMIYGPARMLVAPDSAEWQHVIAIQIVSLAVFTILTAGIQRAGVRRVHSHGG